MLKSEAFIKVNKILNEELFTTDNITIDKMLELLRTKWVNLDSSDKRDISNVIVGKREKNGIIFRGYMDMDKY